jgi:hypothetical protein
MLRLLPRDANAKMETLLPNFICDRKETELPREVCCKTEKDSPIFMLFIRLSPEPSLAIPLKLRELPSSN